MSDRRIDAKIVTPDYEDTGIFRSEVSQFIVDLVPMFAKNSRKDVMIKGFLDGESAIDVVFPGRRTKEVPALRKSLQSLWTQASSNARGIQRPPEVDNVRLRTRIEGAWRPRFKRDDQGWETRDHQLYAARWTVFDADGTAHTFGDRVLK